MTVQAEVQNPQQNTTRCIVIGGGPAGLTAAWELHERNYAVVVFEKDGIVGGISRTESYKGYRYDIGGHRFFSKITTVRDWWERMLGDQFIIRPRLSRIYYNGKFFDYPLRPMNALRGLGLFEAMRCGLSYAWVQLFPSTEEKTFEQWVSNRFGKRLFSIFFRTYTEKVWGMRCDEISADWAAQRIKDLDLLKAVKNALLGGRMSGGKVITSLIEEFHYPRLGPGQMWERVAGRLDQEGQQVVMKTGVELIHHENGRVVGVSVKDEAGNVRREEGDEFISSMPIRELILSLDPPPPEEVLDAARKLRYRDFLTVGLIVDNPNTFPDNWIYIHSPEVKVGRIQNFKAWSPEMLPNDNTSSLGLEYFVQEGDDVWTAADEDLVALGRKEVAKLGLANADEIKDGCVVRMPKAYPVYDDVYKECIATIRAYLQTLPNLHLVGRNGQHRYNNQDHSMMTAIYAAKNIAGEKDDRGRAYDIWAVNTEQEYHEENEDEAKGQAAKGGDRLVPTRADYDERLAIVEATLARYDAVALGAAIGLVFGLGLFLATVLLLLKGGEVVGPNLALLANYFVGFKVSWAGAAIGLVEGGVLGFSIGWFVASLINAVVGFHERRLLRLAEAESAMELSSGD